MRGNNRFRLGGCSNPRFVAHPVRGATFIGHRASQILLFCVSGASEVDRVAKSSLRPADAKQFFRGTCAAIKVEPLTGFRPKQAKTLQNDDSGKETRRGWI